MQHMENISYLGQQDSINLDNDLMGEPAGINFTTEQLMELAGLSCSCVIQEVFPTSKKVLVICGPGNNGGDGLVLSRHLVLAGYHIVIFYPKRPDKPQFKALIAQAKAYNIPFIDALPDNLKEYQLIVDAVFGYSFKGDIRAPFDLILQKISDSGVDVASVDIPSGWDVEKGNVSGKGLNPKLLISLATPKLCAKFFTGQFHYLGGRFLPPSLVEKYKIVLPVYPGSSLCVALPSHKI